ncbi:MAG: hypothetical protein P9M02_02240 [Candidatus Susulua stagnicola]|nr:hypothetical protein [Candidatus Susulua stagnicola]
MKNKENKVQGLVDIIFDIQNSSAKQVATMDGFKKSELPDETITDILNEFLIFNVHQFNRLLFDLFEVSERDEIMDAVTSKVHEHLTYLSSKSPSEIDNNLTERESHRREYFKLKTKHFITSCNTREVEYAQYKIKAEKDESLEGTLLWEFGKKIVDIAGQPRNAFLIIKIINIDTACRINFAEQIKKVLES